MLEARAAAAGMRALPQAHITTLTPKLAATADGQAPVALLGRYADGLAFYGGPYDPPACLGGMLGLG